MSGEKEVWYTTEWRDELGRWPDAWCVMGGDIRTLKEARAEVAAAKRDDAAHGDPNIKYRIVRTTVEVLP